VIFRDIGTIQVSTAYTCTAAERNATLSVEEDSDAAQHPQADAV
jgi:hypothetical protein